MKETKFPNDTIMWSILTLIGKMAFIYKSCNTYSIVLFKMKMLTKKN